MVFYSGNSSKCSFLGCSYIYFLSLEVCCQGIVNEKMNFKTSSPKRNWKSQTATNRRRASTLVFESFSLLHCFKVSRILKIWQCTDFTASNRQVQRVAQDDFSLMYFPNLSLLAKLFKIASLFGEWKKWCEDWTTPSAFFNTMFASTVPGYLAELSSNDVHSNAHRLPLAQSLAF